LDHFERCPLIGLPADSPRPHPRAGAQYYRFNNNYPDALAAFGAAPIIIPLNLPKTALRAVFARLDGLCLPGGGDVDPARYGEAPHPALGPVNQARDSTELALASWALAADLPVLGICRGIQLLNVATGGSLYQDIPSQLSHAVHHDSEPTELPWSQPAHRIRVAAGSQLANILGTQDLMTNSFHHQAIKRLGDGFKAVAWTDDSIIEGIESPSLRFAVGVQWHPEAMFHSDPLARRIFAAFVAATRCDVTTHAN